MTAQAQTDTTAVANTDTVKGFVFTDVISVPTTSVKNQNKSGTCWCFAGTSHLEDEILHAGGDSLDLSEMFTVRQCYLDKARRYVRAQGNAHFSEGGSILDVPYVYSTYGVVPESVYAGLNYGETKHDHGELTRAITAYMQAVASGKKISTAWEAGLNGILDAYFGKVPETFTVNGKTYTPKTYAEALGLDMDNYIAFTSFTHHPFYKSFGLEVADNWICGQYMNLPLDEFKAVVDNALKEGYSVVWAADVSEKGFKWKDGYALLPAAKTEADMEATELSRWVTLSDADREAEQYTFTTPDALVEMNVTQEIRQEMFDRLETTDDHGMVIVGKATDQAGNSYYKVKNSWDTKQVYGGYFYVSEPYFLAKTMSILVNKNGVPKDIRKKIGIK
jgi:bleomycin hydrolase